MAIIRDVRRNKGSRLYRKSNWNRGRGAKKIISVVKKYEDRNKEFKVHDLIVSQEVSSTASVTNLFAPTQGVDYNDRTGRETMERSLEVRGFISAKSGATAGQTARVMIVYDRTPNAVLPAITDINAGSGIITFPNLQNRKRFLTLFDELVTLSPADGDKSQVPVVWKKSLNIQTIYTNANAGVGFGDIRDIESGAFYMVTIGTVATGTGTCMMNGVVRFRFTDS